MLTNGLDDTRSRPLDLQMIIPLKPNGRVGGVPHRASHAKGGMYGYVMSLLSRFFRSADLYKNLLVHLVPFGRQPRALPAMSRTRAGVRL